MYRQKQRQTELYSLHVTAKCQLKCLSYELLTNNKKYWVHKVWIPQLQCSAIVNRAVWWTNASVYKAPAGFMFSVKAGSSEELVSTVLQSGIF
jgi:hypothetical protein